MSDLIQIFDKNFNIFNVEVYKPEWWSNRKFKGRYLKILDNVLTLQECQGLISYIETKEFKQATLNNGTINLEKRNCLRLIIDDAEVTQILFERLKYYLPREAVIRHQKMDIRELNERLRFLKYNNRENHQMSNHKDGIYVRDDGIKKGDMSAHTVILYLNSDFEGGETVLLKGNKQKGLEEYKVKPKIGRALIFQHSMLHRGESLDKNIEEEEYKYAIRTDVMYTPKI